ncbi:flippase [Buttiauxella selenatireducens]|uniref:Flippase n=1 Tax=Buttiauxella selenatireducens TaxID=3073902 RepID=A0ABY9SAM9_9ENTR|nr:flippase [Buttiauxella sp. R73]WMY74579.1 flippase [Buttiauxella sp. R73]
MSLVKNSFLNTIAFVIPAIAAFPAMGIIARYLGVEQFGIFSLIFAMVGYASIFDAGLTRAVIRSIAINKLNNLKCSEIIGSSLAIIVILSIICALAMYHFAPEIISILNVSQSHYMVSVNSLRIVSFTVPIFLITQVLCGYLEGRQDFLWLTIHKSFSGVMVSLIPAFFAMYYHSLYHSFVGLIISRLLSMMIILFVVARKTPLKKIKFSNKVLKEMMMFGGWITLSNLISPVLSYCDKLLLSNLMGARLSAFYTAPADAISKISAFPSAISRALFPVISYEKSPDKIIEYKKTAFKLIFITSIFIAVPIIILSDVIIKVWLGNEFVLHSSNILRVIVIGFVFNSLSQIPYSSIQASGNSRVTALIHLSEVIPYFVLLYFLISQFGVYGAAFAWTIRMILDFFIMNYFSKSLQIV